MPPRRKYLRKRRKTYRPRTMIPKVMSSGMDQNQKLSFKFVDSLKLTTTFAGSVAASRFYVGNGIAFPSPDHTLHQPYGYDQWNGFFTSYTCVSSSIKVSVVAASGDGIIGVRPSRSGTGVDQSIKYMVERPNTKAMLVSSSVPKVITSNATTLKVFGRPWKDASESYSADYAANPGTLWYWVIEYQSPGEAVDVTASLLVEITYKCLLRKRARFASS